MYFEPTHWLLLWLKMLNIAVFFFLNLKNIISCSQVTVVAVVVAANEIYSQETIKWLVNILLKEAIVSPSAAIALIIF